MWQSQECKHLDWCWHQSYHPVHYNTALQSQYQSQECNILLSCLPCTADSAVEQLGQLAVVELQLLELAAVAVVVELLEQPAVLAVVAAAPSVTAAPVDAAP